MDEMKLKLSTKFMRGIVANLISNAILKKVGYDIDVQLNEVHVTTENGKIKLHANVDAEVTNEEFVKIIKSIG